jgi:hypothetical protein
MKHSFIVLGLALLTLGTVSCDNGKSKNKNKTEKKDLKPTTIEFLESNHDFGKITQGEKISHVFKFKNTGENPLVITQVQPSCGCTIPEWTEDPIEAGKEGSIHVMFNSEGKEGKQHKTVTVVANTTPPRSELTFTAEVIKKANK